MDLQHKGLRTYPDGRTVFQSVVVTVPARDDRRGLHDQRRRGRSHQGQRAGARHRQREAGHHRRPDHDRAGGDLRLGRRHHPHSRRRGVRRRSGCAGRRWAPPTTTRATCCGCSSGRASTSRAIARGQGETHMTGGLGRLRACRPLHPPAGRRVGRAGRPDARRRQRDRVHAADRRHRRTDRVARTVVGVAAGAAAAAADGGYRHQPRLSARWPDAAAGDAGRTGGRAVPRRRARHAAGGCRPRSSTCSSMPMDRR